MSYTYNTWSQEKFQRGGGKFEANREGKTRLFSCKLIQIHVITGTAINVFFRIRCND